MHHRLVCPRLLFEELLTHLVTSPAATIVVRVGLSRRGFDCEWLVRGVVAGDGTAPPSAVTDISLVYQGERIGELTYRETPAFILAGWVRFGHVTHPLSTLVLVGAGMYAIDLNATWD